MENTAIDFTLLNKRIIILGKTNSGKTILLRYLLIHEASKFKKIFLFSPTEKTKHYYKNIIPDNCIYDTFNDELVLKIIDKMAIENENKTEETASHILLVLDDTMTDMGRHNKTLDLLATRGRHQYISVIQTAQYLTGIQPVVRGQADFIFTGQGNQASLDLLTQNFIFGNIDKKIFLNLYHKMTSNRGFMLINCSSVEDNENLNSIYARIKVPARFVY